MNDKERKITIQKKKKFLELYAKNMNIARCSRAISTNRCTVHGWMNSDPEFAQAVEDVRESFLDEVESKHYKEAISGTGKGACVSRIHILNTKGKERGYVEAKQDTSGISISIERVVISADKKAPIQIQHSDVKEITYESQEES